MGEHAPLSLSAGAQWLACPASVQRQKGLPDETSPAAEWGTDSHEYVDQGLKLGLSPEFLHDGSEEEREKAECAVEAFDYTQNRQKELAPCVIRTEERVNPGALIDLPDCWGTTDIIIASSHTLEVADFKTGRNIVEPDTPQLWLYLLGVLNQYWPDRSISCPFTTLITTIIQPRAPHEKGPIRSMTWSLNTLLILEQDLRTYGHEALGEAPLAHPGEKQCQWCRAKGNCPEQALWMFGAVTESVGLKPEASIPETIRTLDLTAAAGKAHEIPADILAGYYSLKVSVDNWFAALKDEVFSRLGRREPVPGYKLIRAAGRPTWMGEKDRIPKALRKLKLKKAQIFNDSMKTPLQVMKANLTEEQSTAVADLWSRPEGSLSVVASTKPGEEAMSWLDTVSDNKEK